MSACFMNEMAMACTLGMDATSVGEVIFSQEKQKQDGTAITKELLSGRTSVVYPLKGTLPEISQDLLPLRSRTNRLVQLLLDQLRPSIDKAFQKYGSRRIGCVIGTSTSGMDEAQEAYGIFKKQGKWPSSYHYSQQEPGSPSLFAKAYLGLEGPCYTVSTACSGGAKALVAANRLLKAGLCDRVIAGGVDTLCSLVTNGFDALGLLSPVGCVPMSGNRQGISLGEGGALFVMSHGEEGSSDDVILKGYGESSDGYHATSPHPEGRGAFLAMEQALKQSQVHPYDLAYVSLHGTGTLLNDGVESRVMETLFKGRVPCGSLKGILGHTLAGSGALAAGILWMYLKNGQKGYRQLPPHFWDNVPDPDLPLLPFVTPGTTGGDFSGSVSCMTNSFAFGGSNVSLILQTGAR